MPLSGLRRHCLFCEFCEQRCDGPDIIANYPDDEVRDVVNFTTMFAFLTAVHIADS